MLDLNKLAEECKQIAKARVSNGADIEPPENALKACAGEVIEAVQAQKDAENYYKYLDYPDDRLDRLFSSYAEELADIIICVLVTASNDGIDIEKAVLDKIEKNKLRAERKGDKL